MIRGCLLVAMLLGGCMKTSATYCQKHGAENPAKCPGPDAAQTCTSNAECVETPATIVCNTVSELCVECHAATLQTSACGGSKPVCGANDVCRGCTSHTECASSVCLPDGRCGSEDEIAFVVGQPSPGTGTECTRQSPCDQVSKALTVNRPYIKISGTVVEAVLIDDRDVTLLGAVGATIANNAFDTANLEVKGNSAVKVYDLQIGDGITRTYGVRLDADPTASLLLQRVRVSDNGNIAVSVIRGQISIQRSIIADNPRGGIVVRSGAQKFDIRNNFIYSNGSGSGIASSLFGGVLIEADVMGKLEFNTIGFNESTGLQNRPGIACYGMTNSADGNLVYGNRQAADAAETTLQIGGDCMRGTSFALGSGELGFRNPSLTTPDFHLTSLTPLTVLDAGGMCQSHTNVDIDGQDRANGGPCDVGADELDP